MRPTPVVFDGCAGMLHPGRTSRGIVILNTLGPEGNVVHRGLRELASMLSNDGSFVLRYDLPGTGHSGGDLQSSDLLARWIESVGSAADLLRRSCGVTSVDLVGIRLGASIALLAQAGLGCIGRIAAIATVVRGRSYVRELRMLSRARADAPAAEAGSGSSAIDLAGEILSADLVANLGSIDLRQLRSCRSRVLLIDADRPDVASLTGRLRSLGTEPARREFADGPGFLCEALDSATPDETFEAIRWWLVPEPSLAAVPGCRFEAVALAADRFVEHHVSFGRDDGLRAVLTTPVISDGRSVAALFVNTGVTRSTGDGRITVELARALAEHGVASLRMDIAGIGDSDDRPDRDGGILYGLAAIADVREAVDLLQDRGFLGAVLVGTCSGAYLALHSASADARIRSVIAVNLQKFVWRQGMSVKIDRTRSDRTMRSYLLELRTAAGRKRAARDWRKAVPIALATARRLRRRVARRTRSWLAVRTDASDSWDEAHALLATLSLRRQRIALVYSEDDPGWAELTTLFGRRGRDLRHLDGVSVRAIAGADHILTARHSREIVREMVAAEVAQLVVTDRAADVSASDASVRDVATVRVVPISGRARLLD